MSVVCSIYDPLGMCGPGTLPAKQILQAACKANLSWNDPLPAEIGTSWRKWESNLLLLEQIRIPRCYLNGNTKISWSEVVTVQLHHFSDGSKVGYGTVSYIRLQLRDGQVRVKFIMPKIRCAPKGFVSVPRFELQAATVAARVDRLNRRELCGPTGPVASKLDKVQFWVDSTITLGYVSELMTQVMSDLPKSRTEPYEPAFTVCGMDAFGPLLVKRSRRTVKRYGIIFTCFSTRAVHLEVAEDMSTDSNKRGQRRKPGWEL